MKYIFYILYILLFSSSALALEVDFDREQVQCDKITYQFDFKLAEDRAVYNRVEHYFNVTQERGTSTDHEVCQILFRYFCDASAPFKMDNPKCF